MENVILTVHLILALLLIGIVLLQRSEGGGLMGGGGGGVMSGRQAAGALTKLTWLLAIAFIGTSIALTVLAAQQSKRTSVVDQPGTTAPVEAPAGMAPIVPQGDLLPPPSGDAPATPPPAN
jgi:preprotein translocase subunit SecG